MQSRCKNYQQIYTDGSKEDSKVGCAVISDNHSNMQRIPDDSSIFTAEAKAVDLALDFISTCDANNKFIIFSDSLSVLKAMNHTSSKNPQIQKLLEKCHELLTYKEIVLCWIPSHIGIQGNEMVDKQAKTSLSLEPTSFKIPFSNFKPSINKYILEEWQTSWNNSIGNKLLDIKPTIGEYQSVVRNIRREEVVLARLRLGHTRVTHSYLLQGEEHPQCVGCDAPFTVRHFLLECGDFAQVRNNCLHVNNMKELFQDIHIDSIMTFLRWVFTLFGDILANSNLSKKTIFKEIPTKAIYQYEEGLFGNTPKLLFNRNIISILKYSTQKDGIAKLGNKIVFKKGNRYTCNNTCKSLFMSMLSTSANF